MQDTRQGQNDAVSSTCDDNIEEAMWQLKIEGSDNQDRYVAQSSQFPDRPGEPDCIYYLRTGHCGYGSSCRFNHPAYISQGGQYRDELPERAGQPDCGYFLKTGTCKYGPSCKYNHPQDRHHTGPILFNLLGLPMRQEEKSCPYYMRTGTCKFGAACKFHHPQPASAGSVLPINGTATIGLTGPTAVTSSGQPYVGGFPAWSLRRSLNPSGPQGFVPVVYSSSQGMVPAQGWNTYLGNMVGSGIAYNSRSQSESGSTDQLHLFQPSFPEFPDRPDQPECRYFMNTGTCKYGPDCKYHHPKDRLAQLAPVSVGPLGLPLRPGQAVCSYYSSYGLCKYGPTCKFDHPVPGISYNYGLSLPLPQLSVLDPSFFYQGSSQLPLSSETTTSKSKTLKHSHLKQKPDTAVSSQNQQEAKSQDLLD